MGGGKITLEQQVRHTKIPRCIIGDCIAHLERECKMGSEEIIFLLLRRINKKNDALGINKAEIRILGKIDPSVQMMRNYTMIWSDLLQNNPVERI